MLSRQQVSEQLRSLSNFKFVCYINKISDGVHLVRLHIPEFAKKGLSIHIHTCDWLVTEECGYLSATTYDGCLHISRLS